MSKSNSILSHNSSFNWIEIKPNPSHMWHINFLYYISHIGKIASTNYYLDLYFIFLSFPITSFRLQNYIEPLATKKHKNISNNWRLHKIEMEAKNKWTDIDYHSIYNFSKKDCFLHLSASPTTRTHTHISIYTRMINDKW